MVAIVGYQRVLSPWLGPRCRFEPSCSAFAHQALVRHPLGRALWLITNRLLRCRPGAAFGIDPVPEASASLPSRSNRSTSPV